MEGFRLARDPGSLRQAVVFAVRGRMVSTQGHPPMNSPVSHLMQAGRLDRFFIGGEWVAPDGADRIAVVSPSTEEAVCEIALGNEHDADRAIRAAREAFESWSVTTPRQRAALLDRIHTLMLERAEL